MFTFEVDIGSWTVPVKGGGYIAADPIFNKCKLSKSRAFENLRVRGDFSGNLIFSGSEYTALKTVRDTGETFISIKVYSDSVLQLAGDLSLQGKWNEQSYECELEIIQADLYNKILANLDKEYSMISYTDLVYHSFTSQLRYRYQAIEFGESASYIDWDYYSSDQSYTPDDWVTATAYVEANNDPTDDDLWYAFASNALCKNGGNFYVCISSHTSSAATEPGVGASWTTYWLRTEQPIYNSQEYAPFEFDGSTWVGIGDSTDTSDIHEDEWQKASTTTDTYELTIQTFNMFDMLESILAEIDSSIDVYETTSGANTSYCPYTETGFANKHLKFLKSWEDEPKIKLSEIIEIMKVMHNCDWRLEGTKFVFRHPSERPTLYTGGNYDLTSFQSENWTNYEYQYELTNKVSREVFEFAESNFDDFNTMEILYDNNYEDKQEFKTNYKTDIKHALVDEEYTVVIAAYETGGKYVMYNQIGIFSGETEYNGSLSTSRCVTDHHEEGRPFDDYEDWTGESQQTLRLTSLRNKQVSLNVPIWEIATHNIGTYLYKTSLSNIEVIEIVVNLDGNFAEIKGIF